MKLQYNCYLYRKKTIKNRNSGFVKTCDEYAHSPESSEKLIRMWKHIAPFLNLFKWDTGEVAS